MDNISEDIQCAGSDTRPPMLDRTDFASWQQRIQLYCQGKENGVNILKSFDEGPFQMGTFQETLAEGNEGETIHDYYVRFAKLINDMRNIKMTMSRMQWNSKFVNNMLPEYGRFVTTVKVNRDRESQLYDDFEHSCRHKGETIHDYYVWFAKLITDMRNIKMIMSRMQLNSKFVNNMLLEWVRFVTVVKLKRGLRDSNYDQLGAQNRVRNANSGQASQIKCYNCNDKMLLMQARENGVALDEEQLMFITGGQDNVVDEDVDEQPVQDLALNVDNVFQADDCDAFDSDVDEAPTAQTMFMANLSSTYPVYDEAGPSYDSDILSEVHDHDHYQDAVCEHHEYVKDNSANCTKIFITDRNIKEENLKKELHSVKMQLYSTINRNKSMIEEVTYLKKDFKQKENKYLEEFLDMKALKEKVEDKLYKQDQSLQTVHMLCKPKSYYDEQNKVDIGYKNPLYLTRAQEVQPALYNGHEIIKTNHVLAIVHNSEETLEIAEITRKKMNDKMKDPECVKKKVKIAPHDYLKENYLATFTPHKQLTPGQIFWSKDLLKMKEEALKERTIASRPIKALMYANLEEKHINLLTSQRRIEDGILDVKKAAAKAGVKSAESKFINAIATKISTLNEERKKKRLHYRNENKGFQA
nr:kinesin-like protein KIN12B [Tanacetum cinerariifolium]